MLNMNEFNAHIDTLVEDLMTGYYEEGKNDSGYYHDAMHELVDGSEYVIYYGNAFGLVAMLHECSPSLLRDADEALHCEVSPASIYEHMQLLAYEALYQELSSALQERINDTH